MISRRVLVLSGLLVTALAGSQLHAAASKSFTDKAFSAAQATGKPILIDVFATWCPTCKAQDIILSELGQSPTFKDLIVFKVDFDTRKETLKRFGVRSQSTLIVFKGQTEVGRSVGDTNPSSIEALLRKAL